ncbi:MAG: Asp-tRNA(Asn)/Glu-tRNA(Gln) amidotransferase subunit GatB [Candidatus Pacebacteria bacterium]|nr:Asp-tRNA(Asn)/Glu-tRNA(Gln) amidotransferase subunit GatB [Candidatus Paceibacterota bacterium]
MKYETVIGLEVHVELNTDSKMFCSCKNESDNKTPNINICPVCSGHPGTLPVANKKAIEKTIRVGLALGCQIPEYSKFDRKNYFYPDLPKAYQISQNENPFCLGGSLNVDGRDIKITRIHLEEDAGKLVHSSDSDSSLVDFNRSGVPLMELVTEPVIKSAKEATRFAQELRLILKYLNVSNVDLEKGEMRADANISLSSAPGKLDGVRVEIKNLNSFRSIERALEYEIKRQQELLDSGGVVVQETRGWDDNKQITIGQRSKEQSHDYRYFPDPDLPPVYIKDSGIDLQRIKSSIVELPQQRRSRFQEEYSLSDKETEFLVTDKELGDYYEKVVSELRNWIKETDITLSVDDVMPKLSRLAANYLLTDFQSLRTGDELPIDPENFAEFVCLIYKDKMSSKVAKEVLKEMFNTGGDPSQIIKDKGLTELEDESEIELMIEMVIKENPKAVEDYRQGKEASFKFLIGGIMAKTKGRANPKVIEKILKEKLI